jgi:hypothetical protein
MGRDDNAIQTRAAATVEAAAGPSMADVIASLVVSGDISQLSNVQLAWYYRHRCEALGLDPASKPFDVLTLQGKKILYLNRGGTDQLARIHRVNRRVVDGPKVIDLGGSKQVYVLIEATTPDGRSEQEIATVPLQDPANVLMKCVSKGKRRATISITSAGALDEDELETIPAHLKAPAPPIELDVPAPPKQLSAAAPRPAAPLEDLLADLASAETFEAVVACYAERFRALVASVPADADAQAAVLTTAGDACIARLEGPLALGKQRARFGVLAKIVAADPALWTKGFPAAMGDFLVAVDGVELPAEAVDLWIKHRPALAGLPAPLRELAWKALCKRTEDVGGMKNAKAWLKKAIAVEDARRGTDPEPPRGGGAPTPAADAPVEATAPAVSADARSADEARLLAAITALRACHGPAHVARHHAAHAHELPPAARERYRAFAITHLVSEYPASCVGTGDAVRLLDEAEAARVAKALGGEEKAA